MGLLLGIDLGTTHTVAATVRDGAAPVVSEHGGVRLLPSVVAIGAGGGVSVGNEANGARASLGAEVIHSVKRLIGRPFESSEVQRAISRFGFKLLEGQNREVLVACRGETYTLPEISACVLRQSKAFAEEASGQSAERAVLAVPASFNDVQRGATRFAAELSGLEVIRILNAPTAAALAYGAGPTPQTIGVYSFGGGAFDFTILHVAGSVFEVLGTAGDSSLGGNDVDHLIAERKIEKLHDAHAIDAFERPALVSGLQWVAERLKRDLSIRTVASVELSAALPGAELPKMSFALTRIELEEMSASVVGRTIALCEQALATAGLTASVLDRTIFAGGATRQPLVQTRALELFGRVPESSLNPEEVVALGAAIHASSLDPATCIRNRARSASSNSLAPGGRQGANSIKPEGKTELARIKLKRQAVRPGEAIEEGRAPGSYSIDRKASASLDRHVDRVGEIPADRSGSLGSSSRAVDPDTGSSRRTVEPDTGSSRRTIGDPGSSSRAVDGDPSSSQMVVAAEPSSSRSLDTEPDSSRMFEKEPGSSPSGAGGSPLVIDVTPLSLGVETAGGFCDPLIEANTPIPCDRTRTFATAGDGQTSVTVRIAQGSSMHFRENACLGEIEIRGLEPAPRGEVKIRVTFELDVSGTLKVSARDAKTGRDTEARVLLVATRDSETERITMRARQDFMVLALP